MLANMCLSGIIQSLELDSMEKLVTSYTTNKPPRTSSDTEKINFNHGNNILRKNDTTEQGKAKDC